MKRLTIYFMHSTKFDYNNLIYKFVLSSKVCLRHNIILPRTKQYESVYAKDLINKADLVVVFLNNANLGLDLELNWLKKAGKDVLYISLDGKVKSKYKMRYKNIVVADTENYFINVVEEFIKSNETDEKIDKSAITLGKI